MSVRLHAVCLAALAASAASLGLAGSAFAQHRAPNCADLAGRNIGGARAPLSSMKIGVTR